MNPFHGGHISVGAESLRSPSLQRRAHVERNASRQQFGIVDVIQMDILVEILLGILRKLSDFVGQKPKPGLIPANDEFHPGLASPEDKSFQEPEPGHSITSE